MINKKTISLIIPCRNEEEGIGKLIKSLPKFIDEVIVVDNRSTDNTSKVAKEAGAIVVKEDRAVDGIGYGYAHISGIAKASGDYIAAMDGDDTYPSKDIKEIVKLLDKTKIDFISCNRFPLLNKNAITGTRQLGVKVLNTVVFALYGYRIQDTLTGMWVFKKEIKNDLNLQEGGWDLSPEIKLNAIVNPKINFAEYHIDHFFRVGESVQQIWKTGFQHLWYIIKKRFTDDFKYFSFAGFFKKPKRIEGTDIKIKSLNTSI